MSVHVMSWVLKHSTSTLGERLVLLSLADKAEDDGTEARPSVATLSREARLSERQVQRCLRNLEQRGEIQATGTHRYPGQRRGVNVYRVIMKGDNMSPFVSAKGDIRDIQRVTPMSPNPSLGPTQDQLLAAAPQNGHTQKPRNEIWDALQHMFGEPTTPSATKLRGKIVQELKQAGATYDEILKRGRQWPNHFDTATLTEPALAKHWDRLGRRPLRAGGR